MSLPRLCIVATGGTIAGAGARPQSTMAYAAGALDVAELCARVPGLDEVAAIQAEQFAAIDSKNATPAFWQSLAARVQALLDGGADGVVVTHGTDTLEETAYYLHLALKTDRPVVLVGAMRPATALSPDGPLNLLDAVTVAAAPQAAGRGVLVALNHQILCARDAAKTNANRPDAFAAPNAGALGWVQDGRVAWMGRPERPHTRATPFTAATPLPQVEVLAGYAGGSAALIRAVAATGARGLVWAGTGNGSASADAQEALDELRQGGVAVVRATRTGSGCVAASGGLPGAGTLSPWKARVLLMLALGAGTDDIQAAFDTY
ncbi:asparaginase [Pigmentiphaga kullae]|uniref:Asparaginase n=1 Tax=Pigmentiphaga kullae TaxID=151784 RepID=A0A4Q7ND95_9BURK|nr:asparaginase [Pigmentiphaga kullae]RZS81022.1 asparaginase [Pigmentiphaga kullae]